MNEKRFRLRMNFQKRERLRFLSHLELVRLLERIIRRAQLPIATSQGFNVHMRFAPGPALPVGVAGLDEYFDVWLNSYVDPAAATVLLRASSVEGLVILGCEYVELKARGLQATHIFEYFEVVLHPGAMTAAKIRQAFDELLATGKLNVERKKRTKSYDLDSLVKRVLVEEAEEGFPLTVHFEIRANEQGSIRPELLLQTALSADDSWKIHSISRTRLSEEPQQGD